MDKKSIRRLYKEKRRNMDALEVSLSSEEILNIFISSEEYKASNNILTYVSHDNEVDTSNLIKTALNDNKNVAAPKVYGDIMHFHRISSLEDLKEGAFGILEPGGNEIFEPQNGIIIVPGIAFDGECHRVGYGGGYYDRFLEANGGLLSVAFAYDFQITDCISPDEYDKKPDIIITPTKLYKNK